LALQAEEETPRERRRRAVRRGRGLLDALDGLRLALVEGRADAQLLAGMAQNLAGRCGQTGDAALDDTLSAIEVRVQVELAKRGL
ncbi:flagellar assembly protein FliX, partial [Hansschlegelia beijingensis]